MKYDFDTIIDRSHSLSCKWDVEDGVIPLTVADMDFKAAPKIVDKLTSLSNSGIYGYIDVPKNWVSSYISYFHDRYHFDIKEEWLLFSNGVIPTVSSSIRSLTSIGDKVIMMTPIYNTFYNSILNNHRIPYEIPLINRENRFSVDWEAMEKAFKDPKATLFILCNPHNPTGNIYSKEELARLGELARTNNVIVLADEIHGFLTRPGVDYIPYLSASEENKKGCLMATSVTKAFNLASIHTSAVIIPDPELRERVHKGLGADEVNESNLLAGEAAVTALNDCRDWLDECRSYLFSNRDYLDDYLNKNIPEMKSVKSDATYLVWIDISQISKDSESFCDYLRKEAKVLVNPGIHYGLGGEGYIRMNIAYPRKVLEDALDRIKKAVRKYKDR